MLYILAKVKLIKLKGISFPFWFKSFISIYKNKYSKVKGAKKQVSGTMSIGIRNVCFLTIFTLVNNTGTYFYSYLYKGFQEENNTEIADELDWDLEIKNKSKKCLVSGLGRYYEKLLRNLHYFHTVS